MANVLILAGNAAEDLETMSLGLLRGRRSSGFGPLAPDIEMAGGEYVDGPAVVDGNMVSCRGWGDLAEWSRAFLDVLDRAAVPA